MQKLGQIALHPVTANIPQIGSLQTAGNFSNDSDDGIVKFRGVYGTSDAKTGEFKPSRSDILDEIRRDPAAAISNRKNQIKNLQKRLEKNNERQQTAKTKGNKRRLRALESAEGKIQSTISHFKEEIKMANAELIRRKNRGITLRPPIAI